MKYIFVLPPRGYTWYYMSLWRAACWLDQYFDPCVRGKEKWVKFSCFVVKHKNGKRNRTSKLFLTVLWGKYEVNRIFISEVENIIHYTWQTFCPLQNNSVSSRASSLLHTWTQRCSLHILSGVAEWFTALRRQRGCRNHCVVFENNHYPTTYAVKYLLKRLLFGI